jgi:hypothetical protein
LRSSTPNTEKICDYLIAVISFIFKMMFFYTSLVHSHKP